MIQVDILRRLTPKQRLEQSFLLSDLVLELAVKNIKKQLGENTTSAQVQKLLQERFSLS